jgi:hypothetical protein
VPLASHSESPACRQFSLLSATITAAAAGVLGAVVTGLQGAYYLGAQAVFTYGSGGTSAKFWVQTSLDGGVTWLDVMSFAFLTATATKMSAVVTTTALAAAATPSDAALADNTILSGVLGDQVRVKYTSVGTYAGGTTIAIGAVAKG